MLLTDEVHRGILYSVLFFPLAGALFVSFLVTPEQIESGQVQLTPTCQMKMIFDRPCPTCGLSRAFSAVSHGRFSDAMQYNRASLFFYAAWLVGALLGLVGLIRTSIGLFQLCRSQSRPEYQRR